MIQNITTVKIDGFQWQFTGAVRIERAAHRLTLRYQDGTETKKSFKTATAAQSHLDALWKWMDSQNPESVAFGGCYVTECRGAKRAVESIAFQPVYEYVFFTATDFGNLPNYEYLYNWHITSSDLRSYTVSDYPLHKRRNRIPEGALRTLQNLQPYANVIVSEHCAAMYTKNGRLWFAVCSAPVGTPEAVLPPLYAPEPCYSVKALPPQGVMPEPMRWVLQRMTALRGHILTAQDRYNTLHPLHPEQVVITLQCAVMMGSHVTADRLGDAPYRIETNADKSHIVLMESDGGEVWRIEYTPHPVQHP